MHTPDPNEFDHTPRCTWVRPNGQVVRVFQHRTQPERNRVTVDEAPFDPWGMVDRARV